ncbi:DUF1810 domain-containing protein [Aestuariivirga sp.]|uniref:DUF1810 domain-containing protein n=1 Tax=Aestuariivirga sp. TaxID=2650926 RepID=UPI003918E44C
MTLQRFIDAQTPVIEEATAELAAGSKKSHWMWFVFPQLSGLGRSDIAHFYGISDLEEARRYLAHPVLGVRLRRHVQLMIEHKAKTARQILGTPDDLKFRSCLTLFLTASRAEADRSLFEAALCQFYGGERDPRTVMLLEGRGLPQSDI